jgi:type I restriction enzyme S subunit
VYAFLSSWIGQTLLAKDRYGSAILHLEPDHLNAISIPALPSIEEEIHAKIIGAYALRQKANALLDEGEKLLAQELGLRQLRIHPEDPYFFSMKSSELGHRFDASYHNPLLRTIAQQMKEKYQPKPLASFASVYMPPRFKRTYVEKEQGVPFLQGKHIVELRPFGLKFISRSTTKNLEKWIIKKGMILVTRSGTIGRVSLVPSAWDAWAASEHMLRICPNDPDDAGYLALFLMNPYGYHQLTGKTYGGVIGEIAEHHARQILVPDCPPAVRARIGRTVVDAFELREQANTTEREAIAAVELALQAAP